MRDIKRIFVHCSFTKPREGRAGSPLIGASEIRKWHVEERRWSDIGYHYVIKRDGTLELGRPVERQGAHAAGHNEDSIGICLVGGMDKKTGKAVKDYTDVQWEQLELLVRGLVAKYNISDSNVLGHNDVTTTKTCPNFDVKYWWTQEVNG
jgi:N-acetylmuramoyl-L-alanine amidase